MHAGTASVQSACIGGAAGVLTALVHAGGGNYTGLLFTDYLLSPHLSHYHLQ
jgi:hypothetical protein